MAERIGPYRLERLLGSGGMGVVHLAHAPDGKRVALKVMHTQWSTQPEFLERFRDEAEAARRVARFCTAAVLDASFGEPAYLVTEYIEGETLAAVLAMDGALDGGRLESVAVGTAVALGAIHNAGIVHRDLKPGNIILSPYGPKVIDFGIAQIENTEGRTGPFVFGTPPVIAPERFQGQRATAASDVFSWGCVVAYAGTGRWPFGSSSTEAVRFLTMNSPRDLDGLDERLTPLVRAALAVDPAARPSVAQLLKEMTGSGLQLTQEIALPDRTVPPPAPITTVPPAPPVPGRWRSGRVRALLAVGVVAAAIAAVSAVLFVPSSQKLLRHDDFSGRYWWPEGRYTTPITASAELVDGRYRLKVSNPSRLPNQAGIPASANVDTSRRDGVVVAARASGTGAYGVWCRGTPAKRPLAKYEFYAAGTGEAAIVKRAANGQSTELRPFRPAFLPAPVNHIEARCQGRRNGVRLVLTVNGKKVATVTDRTAPLGPGAVGVVAYARDVPEAAADFDSFTVETG
ncbi:serine/threonine-protein kinase [Actinomadura sp. 9N407]|uniref:serine/threonine-protein kinase n=1 Tax=Actinomadura sp. 9N407 TaxID=3375154 RepID=UPI0037A28693